MSGYRALLAAALALGVAPLSAQPAAAPAAATAAEPGPFVAEKASIRVRDGARLETAIWYPVGRHGPLPILFLRTPYGIPKDAPKTMPSQLAALAKDGYIFVWQSMRGRFGSTGRFTMSTALAGRRGTDEATDAYDSIAWLVRHVRGNSGKVGMWGVSYPGLAAAIALAKPHPALKAVSPQAAWTDYWSGDDLHRNGALRLSYATDWVYSLQIDDKSLPDFPYANADTYDWFLHAGSPDRIERAYMKGKVPLYRALIEHPQHDAFYTAQNWHKALGRTRVPTLNVAGYWDQEDPSGSWQIYFQQQRDDPDNLAQMVAGPWNHGGWRTPADKLGAIPIGSEAGTSFLSEVEAPFFRHWLHGEGAKPDFEVKSFQSGSWKWRSYAQWPPRTAAKTALYLHDNGTLSFTAPAAGEVCSSYVADPAHPVPFRARPISPTYPAPEWRWWETADQRFVDGRPDVLTWQSEALDADLTVTGTWAAALQASTSGTDGDFIVKVIDVLPQDSDTPKVDGKLGDYGKTLDGYQWPIAMEVRRGRFLDSETTPKPLVPDQVRGWDVPLREHDHVFLKGHRIMVQIQSSWFPVIDRNPQTFVPNIAKAEPGDYRAATQRICPGSKIVLPVMP